MEIQSWMQWLLLACLFASIWLVSFELTSVQKERAWVQLAVVVIVSMWFGVGIPWVVLVAVVAIGLRWLFNVTFDS
ncbi:MAG TPA: hypothetical protein VLH19_05790 [Patescibacteria group bacterium]|nr:hypothetical protein [Patescibacteria group bacterium]